MILKRSHSISLDNAIISVKFLLVEKTRLTNYQIVDRIRCQNSRHHFLSFPRFPGKNVQSYDQINAIKLSNNKRKCEGPKLCSWHISTQNEFVKAKIDLSFLFAVKWMTATYRSLLLRNTYIHTCMIASWEAWNSELQINVFELVRLQ